MTGAVSDHAARDHATWSASAAKGNIACAGRLALTMNLPESTNEPADWGTCAHEIAEACLTRNIDADSFIGQVLKGKKFSFTVDDEMAETAQEFVDYVRDGYGDDSTLWVEQRFSFADLKPPFDSGGTGDAVIYSPYTRVLEVVDLKGGRGVVVEAKGNPQLRSYGLGALLSNPGLDVQTVKVTIVQPRAPHKDGRIRSESFTVADLLDWTVEMLAAMKRSKQALDERSAIVGEATEEAWAEKWLTAGTHCKDTFCKAAATCPALRMKVEREVGLHFDPITEAPALRNAPDSGDPDERAKRLDLLAMIEGWVKDVRAHEHRMAEMGQPATGYGLVEKTGHETWTDADAEAKAREIVAASGLPEDKYVNPGKLKTPKQIRAALKKAKADASALAGLSSQNATGTNLVRLDESIRPAIPLVDQHFEAITEN